MRKDPSFASTASVRLKAVFFALGVRDVGRSVQADAVPETITRDFHNITRFPALVAENPFGNGEREINFVAPLAPFLGQFVRVTALQCHRDLAALPCAGGSMIFRRPA